MTDQVIGTSHLDNPPDTQEVEGIDLEEEAPAGTLNRTTSLIL